MKDELFDKLVSWENLLLAQYKTKRGRRYRPDVLGFSYNIEKQLIKIKEEMIKFLYIPSNYFSFVVNDSKKRTIWAAPFKDRIVHHALCNVLEPIFEKSFIFDNYACRVDKGSNRAILRLQYFLRSLGGGRLEGKIFCLKCDISKYFDSIDHEILKRIIRKKISSPGLLWLIDLIIDSYGKGTGIPIGNLTSQLFANIYLNELDHFIKDRLGIRCYIRYMDDFVILGSDKDQLFKLRSLIKEFLESNLKLKLHPKKTEYFPVDKGIDFLGYIVFEDYILLRKSTVKRYIKKLRKRLGKLDNKDVLQEELDRSFLAWYSYYHHARCHRLICRLYGKMVDRIKC